MPKTSPVASPLSSCTVSTVEGRVTLKGDDGPRPPAPPPAHPSGASRARGPAEGVHGEHLLATVGGQGNRA